MRISDWSSDVCSSDLAIPEGLYPGDYLKPVGERLATDHGDRFVGASESEWLALFRTVAVAAMMEMIRADLAQLGLHHDLFASEADLQAAGQPAAADKWLREPGSVSGGQFWAPMGDPRSAERCYGEGV